MHHRKIRRAFPGISTSAVWYGNRPGQKHSAETRAKISAAGRRRFKDPLERAKSRERTRALWADSEYREARRKDQTTHGHRGPSHRHSPSPTYRTWLSMKTRCFNANYYHFHLYGGRGITVCQEWKDSFEAFLRDMGERPEGKTLDRIDPDGNYEPGNCRWATPKEQAANTRRAKAKALEAVAA